MNVLRAPLMHTPLFQEQCLEADENECVYASELLIVLMFVFFFVSVRLRGWRNLELLPLFVTGFPSRRAQFLKMIAARQK